MNKPVSRLETVPIRDAFKSEPHGFTRWLEANIEALQVRIGMGALNVVQREQAVGDFKLDLLCEDSDGRPVIIENQLEQTNHDHLGKLLTYLVNMEARSAIWITTEPRQEHQKVIEWLNESTPATIAVYLVKVEAVKIGDSPLAPLFTVLTAPDTQTKEIGKSKKEWAARQHDQLDFWTALLNLSKPQRTALFSSTSPSHSDWISTGAGISGVKFNYVVRKDWAAVELYVDLDTETGTKNKKLFDAFFAQRMVIEQEIGNPLVWDRLPEKRATRIRHKFATGLNQRDRWPRLHEEMIEMMIKFETAFRDRLALTRNI